MCSFVSSVLLTAPLKIQENTICKVKSDASSKLWESLFAIVLPSFSIHIFSSWSLYIIYLCIYTDKAGRVIWSLNKNVIRIAYSRHVCDAFLPFERTHSLFQYCEFEVCSPTTTETSLSYELLMPCFARFNVYFVDRPNEIRIITFWYFTRKIAFIGRVKFVDTSTLSFHKFPDARTLSGRVYWSPLEMKSCVNW